MNTKEVAEKTVKKDKILCPHCGKELDQLKIRKSAAAILGKAKSERKTASCRENGLKGGRPKNLRGGRPKKQTAETKQ